MFSQLTDSLENTLKNLRGQGKLTEENVAESLRVFDGLNKENPVQVPQDSQFALLQERAKLSKFTADFLVSEAMKMSDHEYELYVEKKHARAEGHAEGVVEGRQQMADILRAKGISEEIISEALAQK